MPPLPFTKGTVLHQIDELLSRTAGTGTDGPTTMPTGTLHYPAQTGCELSK